MTLNKDRTYQNDADYSDYIDRAKANILDKTAAVIIKTGQGATAGTETTAAVIYTDIASGDRIMVQMVTYATIAYVLKQTPTVSSGFALTFNTAPGIGTFDWAVIRDITVVS